MNIQQLFLLSIDWRRKWQSTPVRLPGKSHGQRSLVGYSPWGCKSRTRLCDYTFNFHFYFIVYRLDTSSDFIGTNNKEILSLGILKISSRFVLYFTYISKHSVSFMSFTQHFPYYSKNITIGSTLTDIQPLISRNCDYFILCS